MKIFYSVTSVIRHHCQYYKRTFPGTRWRDGVTMEKEKMVNKKKYKEELEPIMCLSFLRMYVYT